MILNLDKTKTTIELEENELNVLFKEVHPTAFTTGQVLRILTEIYSANFEQDVVDAIQDLQETTE